VRHPQSRRQRPAHRPHRAGDALPGLETRQRGTSASRPSRYRQTFVRWRLPCVAVQHRVDVACPSRLRTVTCVDETGVMSMPLEELSNPPRIVFLVSVGAFLAGELVQAFRSRRDARRCAGRSRVQGVVPRRDPAHRS
jgi:hypothetical protein